MKGREGVMQCNQRMSGRTQELPFIGSCPHQLRRGRNICTIILIRQAPLLALYSVSCLHYTYGQYIVLCCMIIGCERFKYVVELLFDV